ncbi:hypothetical protein A4A49_23324 [Nicotiana attenuata]|uniref:Uncharacterized protein n=1 Tax=Nicotiana attenuata TaxID=49451 RepID=A0A1J6IT67_NICAT|nr:hypothetical protein A4A49_23324 [Nicotiana attenuata]
MIDASKVATHRFDNSRIIPSIKFHLSIQLNYEAHSHFINIYGFDHQFIVSKLHMGQGHDWLQSGYLNFHFLTLVLSYMDNYSFIVLKYIDMR